MEWFGNFVWWRHKYGFSVHAVKTQEQIMRVRCKKIIVETYYFN